MDSGGLVDSAGLVDSGGLMDSGGLVDTKGGGISRLLFQLEFCPGGVTLLCGLVPRLGGFVEKGLLPVCGSAEIVGGPGDGALATLGIP